MDRLVRVVLQRFHTLEIEMRIEPLSARGHQRGPFRVLAPLARLSSRQHRLDTDAWTLETTATYSHPTCATSCLAPGLQRDG